MLLLLRVGLNQIDEQAYAPSSAEFLPLPRANRDVDGILHVEENGYVRFIAGSPQWQSSRVASIDMSAVKTGSSDRFPMDSINKPSTEDMVDALPSRQNCTELV
ncbi:hypothetical protein CERZMDRAFT_95594 [Cercospora zeae-maydis SCOH1-5]|uniref:Uncharacterized protein n=1 Tax=Cercospora zeae-maydis SCOH1-5 TaxID=717836 RepID=A0A6A6FLH4_9PEZI|nr:hypothetical protein CERZMDRAFT_95594 [Cercospora zeae-maydis SCOH1-5]